MEVHPLARCRRHSDTAASIGKIISLASEKAVEMGENDGISDEDSISIVGGDFNAILHSGERLNGVVPHTGSMKDFATALLDCGLMDGGYKGNSFTWTNNRMFQRLDRMAYNHHWANFFASTRIQHLNRDGSDHCPLLISCSKNQDRVPSSFRFLHAWVLHHGFKKFLEQNWTSSIVGFRLQAFWVKQRCLKQALKRWNKEVFGDIFHNLKVAEQRAADCEIIFNRRSQWRTELP
ncbi:PREDICTED: uncharacterized protein LOC108663048 [Theobroma cacao]|uniref:Uncharacterized protein LOC108663048 n=1 Tax=Theobroma cacao TaxID=3641 RepID=A0AB32WPN2_THECC|nr:PREDICTED: uncharacterized protein LOC108663048 [Theobroma cacao]